MADPLIRDEYCCFEGNLVTDVGCHELEPWNPRKGSGLEMKAGKSLGRSVCSNQVSE